MNKLKQSIQSELNNMKFKYEIDNNDDDGLFVFSIKMDNSTGSLKMIIQLLGERFLVYALLSNRAPRAKLSAVSEFLNRANFGLINGNFELNYSTGEVRYKSFVNAKEINVSSAIIRDSILVPVMMFSKYGDGLLNVMTSKNTPESIIRNIE